MKIQDYADALNLRLHITRYDNQKERWSASFEGVEVKNGAILASVYGNGTTPDEAIYAYIAKIRDKRIVINAMSDNRREYDCPKDLEY